MCGGLLRKIQTQAWLNLSQPFPDGCKWNVEHQIGARIEPQGRVGGFRVWRCSWLPGRGKWLSGSNASDSILISMPPKRGSGKKIPRASRLHAIHQDICVMHHAFIAWPYFDGFEPARFIYRSAENKIPVLVSAAGGELIRLFRLDDELRRPYLPAFLQISEWAADSEERSFDDALFHPMSDHGDLSVGESKLIRKFKFAGFRQPRWHEPALGNGGDLPRVRFCILIGQQWEGPRLAGAMARGAMVKQ